jgi:NADH:ubiquinone oxidoreductase subunit 5 (subunit L)/multisubunit Na+/H+ antiporter MnhA subunit
MSGVMSKLGVYGILRAFLIAGMPDLLFSYIFLAISLLSAFLGAVYASGQRDLKRALAYSSVENMGIIGAGLATGLIGLNLGNMPAAVLGFAGALIHIVNHSLFKQALFFGAGSVYISTHTRDIETLGGLSRKMPYTAFFFLVSAASISALPPFNGFISEFFVYRSLIENALTGNPAAIAAAAFGLAAVSITGGIIVICFTRLYGIVFAGSERSEKAEHATEVGLLMLFPAGLLVAMCVAIGIFPQPIIRLVMEPVMMFTGTGSGSTFAAVFSGVPVISGYFASFAAFAALLYFFRKLLLRGRVQTKAATWTCGYSRPNPRMQYSAYSYSQQIMNLAEPFVIKEKELKRPEGIFPSKAYSEHHIKDIFEQLIIKPAGFVVKKGLALFSWVQSGNLQHYLLYGIFLLILALMFAWVK